VIHLERVPERWESVSAVRAALPCEVEQVPAVDARSEPQHVLAARGQVLGRPPHEVGPSLLRSRPFALVEEACFASHLRALERFLASDASWGLILEDDVVARREIWAELAEILRYVADGDVVKLEGIRHRGRRWAVVEARLSSGAALVRSLRASTGAAAYIVSRSAARRLVERAGTIRVPFDDYLANPAWHGCRVLHVSPWLLWQSGAPSTMRELRRPLRGARERRWWLRVPRAARRFRLRIATAASAFVGRPGRIVRAAW